MPELVGEDFTDPDGSDARRVWATTTGPGIAFAWGKRLQRDPSVPQGPVYVCEIELDESIIAADVNGMPNDPGSVMATSGRVMGLIGGFRSGADAEAGEHSQPPQSD